MDEPERLSVGVVFDVVCPWCYIGERQLMRALAERPDLSYRLEYHPFLLHPSLPPEGVERDVLMKQKFGSMDVAQAMRERVSDTGETVGIEFRFDDIDRVPDTLAAHCLVQWAPNEVQPKLVEALYRAYFEDGRNIGDPEVLAELASGFGMNAGEVRQRLERGEDRENVRAHADEMRREGVTGVPFFVIDGRFAIPGAQEPKVILSVIDGALRQCAG